MRVDPPDARCTGWPRSQHQATFAGKLAVNPKDYEALAEAGMAGRPDCVSTLLSHSPHLQNVDRALSKPIFLFGS